jgi:hypothetical protein
MRWLRDFEPPPNGKVPFVSKTGMNFDDSEMSETLSVLRIRFEPARGHASELPRAWIASPVLKDGA